MRLGCLAGLIALASCLEAPRVRDDGQARARAASTRAEPFGEARFDDSSAPHRSERELESGAARRGEDLVRLSERPLSLEDLQATARDRSARGLLVRAGIAGAEARTRQALAAFFPALSTRSEYVRLNDQIEFEDPLGGGTFVAQDDEVFSQTTTLGFLLWDGGGRGANWRASRASEEMVRAQAARELQRLDREVAESYLSWAEALQESAVLAASVEALEGALERARSLEALGRATRSDVLVVEVELERTRYDTRRLRDIAADALDELTRLLSLPAGATLVEPAPRETESLLEAARSLESFDIGAAALERRAELLAIAEERRAAQFALEAENARYWPRVDLFVEHQYSTTESDLLDPNVVTGGVRAEWEIFSGFSTRNRAAELEARLREIAARAEDLRAAIIREVRRAERDVTRAADGLEVARRGIERAEENLRQLSDRFDEGRATGQELLEAETLLRGERARAVQARFAFERALASLRFAVGLELGEDLASR